MRRFTANALLPMPRAGNIGDQIGIQCQLSDEQSGSRVVVRDHCTCPPFKSTKNNDKIINRKMKE